MRSLGERLTSLKGSPSLQYVLPSAGSLVFVNNRLAVNAKTYKRGTKF